MAVESLLPWGAVAVSAVAAAAILGLDRRPNLREACTFAAAGVKVILVLSLVPGALDGAAAGCRLLEWFPGVGLELRADTWGVAFAAVASFLWLLTSVYSVGYMRGLREHAQTRYFACFALAMSATMGVAFAANLLTLYLFYEILTLATYPLVVHKQTGDAVAAGRKYLAYTLSAGMVILGCAAGIYALTGTLDFHAGGIAWSESARRHPWLLRALFGLLIAGFGVKAALMPLHGWLPTAMIAPTPVSALLHAVAVVKSGVFGCVRVIGFVFGPQLLAELGATSGLLAVAMFTILAGSLLALAQDNLKRRLAYSTVSQLSYIVLGAALLVPAGMEGAVFHLASHAFLKITLFFCAGAIYVTTGRERVSELDGIGRRMPWTMTAFAVAALGLAGVPPSNGFISKWWLCAGSLRAGHPEAAVVLVLSGLLNIAYLFPIVYRAFFVPGERFGEGGDAAWSMRGPLLITAAASVALGLVPDAGLRLWALSRAVAEELW